MANTAPVPAPVDPAIASALRTVKTEADGLAALSAALSDGLGAPFSEAVRIMGAATGRVIVTGMGKSGHVGRKIAATMASTGTPAHFVHPGEASHGDLGMIQTDDVILALSWSGETAELSDIITYARRFAVKLVAVTSNPGSSLGRQADVCLTLPRTAEACPNGLAPTTSTTMQLAIGDALSVALLEARGFGPKDFHVFHPGGKLGSLLKQVRSIMHGGDKLPLVPAGTPMPDAIRIMTDKGFGCVLVTRDDLTIEGIITDGDLRRHMSPTLPSLAVEAVMTRNPRTVPPDTLLAEALKIIETRKITALVVAENGRAVGLVHIMDLLRTGAA
ncbi:SIS domain-containing protein [uncultured Alsobacter sp.]|uniref:KpsF/GutQ family sugar-phosphate isomerase n=1 Tax=uncultured Alsobacter sp. TaxID=1748258 RepID=UPI0025CE6950|nr:KpsF/GutQ family sugar-phosphate isomerase [uncultured Alsobacter sp.]